jgi:2-polyprenyl-6-methoxyphenol hydroxylase-like FAD-dependent oxidoreductase
MRILIVGAGIAGLATYRALAQRGFRPRLVERSHQAGAGGAALFMPGNGVRALGELGLRDALMNISVPIAYQRFFDEAGRLLSEIDADEFWRDVAPCRSMKRSALWDLLRQGVDDDAIRLCSIRDISSGRHWSRVTFQDGATEEYDLVIGADGVHSTVRRSVFPETATPRYVGNVCWRSIVPNICHIRQWTVMLGATTSLLVAPVSSSELYVYADISADEARRKSYSPATALKPLFGRIAGPLCPILDLCAQTNVHYGELVSLQLDRWCRDRVVLVGDAAHASPPSMAQGASMAIEDAIVLADELADTLCVETALLRYQTRRRKRVDWVHRQCASRDKMRRLPPILRNALLRFASGRLYRRSYGPLIDPM